MLQARQEGLSYAKKNMNLLPVEDGEAERMHAIRTDIPDHRIRELLRL